jgi:5-methylcytosine-specific restriction endonuclease McrA
MPFGHRRPIGRGGKPLSDWYPDLYNEHGTYDLQTHYRRKREKDQHRYVPVQTRRDLWQRNHGACVRCGSTAGLTIDHIVPVSYGGTSELSNLQLLCKSCNGKKGFEDQSRYRPEDRKPLDERYR